MIKARPVLCIGTMVAILLFLLFETPYRNHRR